MVIFTKQQQQKNITQPFKRLGSYTFMKLILLFSKDAFNWSKVTADI